MALPAFKEVTYNSKSTTFRFVVQFVQSSMVPSLWVCQECGAMTGDYPKHGIWHGKLEERMLLLGH